MGDRPLTLADAAQLAGLPVEVLYGLIVRGQLPAHRDPDSETWVIEPDDLRQYIQNS